MVVQAGLGCLGGGGGRGDEPGHETHSQRMKGVPSCLPFPASLHFSEGQNMLMPRLPAMPKT
jgi:hypothetical protein